jgi:putative endonuclease
MHLAPSLSSSPTPAKRRAAEFLGRVAEADIAAHWEAQGYEILARRLRTSAGEIDLVVASGETLIFIEVKARTTLAAAAYAVSPRQQARLLEAASISLATHPAWQRSATRFDVALVSPAGIAHIEDAIRYH